jgi:Protein of unknown function (DUF1153)
VNYRSQPNVQDNGGADWLLDVGNTASVESLPPTNTKRWVIRRKAEVVAAVRAGVISLEDACQRYTLSVEEFLSWQRLVDSHGLPGLRVTRLQDYRAAAPRPPAPKASVP